MNDSGFITTNVDVYGKPEPWEIYSHGVPCDDDDGDDSQYHFFIVKLKKKNKSRYHRNVENKGSCKQQDRGKPIRKGEGPMIGYKKSMSYVNKGYNRKNGHWLMKEYELSTTILEKFGHDCRDYELCAIKKRTILLDNAPEENCNNLEHETTTFLNFQESAPEVVESTKYDEPLQGVLIKPYDAGDYMQRTSVPELDALVLHPLIKKNLEELGVMLHDICNDEDLIIVIEPLLAPYTFEAASVLNFDHEYVPGLDHPWATTMSHYWPLILLKPHLCSILIMNVCLAWIIHILLDSDNIDQILQGICSDRWR